MKRVSRLFKFPASELAKWQKKADRETEGNLSEWIRRRCNEPSNFEKYVRQSLARLLRRNK